MPMCPRIADPVVIVTSYNMGSIVLSSYGRHPGTTITVSCLTPEQYVLKGPPTLTCLRTGKWDRQIPQCIAKNKLVLLATEAPLPLAANAQTSSQSTLSMMDSLPYLVISVLALLFICLIIAILYLVHLRKSLAVSIDEVEKQHTVSSLATLSTTSSSSEYARHEEPRAADSLHNMYPFRGRPILRDYFSRYGLSKNQGSPESDREARYSTIGDFLVYR